MKEIEIKGRPSSQLWITLLTALTLFCLGGVEQAQAQSQWTTATNSTDIYNTNTSTGKVGIGTTSPNGGTVQIQSATLDNHLYISSAAPDVVLGNNATRSAATRIGFIGLATGSNHFFSGSVAGDFTAGTTPGGGNFLLGTAGTAAMAIDTSQRVGIGTTTPAQRLDVGGSLAINGATVINSSRILSARSSFNNYTADGVWNAQATPSTIFAPSSYINTGFLFGYEDAGTGQYTPSLGISLPPDPPNGMLARVLQVRQFGGTTPESYNRFEVNIKGTLSWGGGGQAPDTSLTRSGAGTLALTGGFNVSGNVGVGGNTNITGTLTATGGITGTTINATYQDVAEWVPATHALAAGTVVVLNPTKSNEVMASEKSYDTGVAGVVSARPGLTLGEAGKDKALVATTGRVKVKVDATRAPIHVGDLLVTSDQEGVAMKSVPVNLGGVEIHRPGTLIGKALEPLEKGTGEILVLLSLQ